MGKSSAETTLIILMAKAGFLLDSGPGHSHCGVGGKSKNQNRTLCFLVSSGMEVIISGEDQADTDHVFTLFAFSFPLKTLSGFPGK